ncbi:MAG TPA: LamG domain-containing protein [Polyangia bacterium]|nr:LamG domain-containing protein [Polyangia bacterium]
MRTRRYWWNGLSLFAGALAVVGGGCDHATAGSKGVGGAGGQAGATDGSVAGAAGGSVGGQAMSGAGGAAGGQSTGGAAGAAVMGSGGGGAGGTGGQPTDGGASDASPTCPVAFDGSNLSSGLVSWWRAEGNGNDSAGHNNNGFLENVSFVPGPLGGQAFNFDGTTSDVVVQTSTTLDVATGFGLSLWIEVAAWPSAGTVIVDKWVYGQEDKLISLHPDGHIGFLLYPTASQQVVSSTALTLGTWHHVAATYEGTTVRIYIDGVLDASAPAAGDVADSTGSLTFAHNAVRGAQEPVNNGFFAGALDEVRWYNRALSAAEIAALHDGCN